MQTYLSPGTASSVPVSAADRPLRVTGAVAAVVAVAAAVDDGATADGAGIPPVRRHLRHLVPPQSGKNQLSASARTVVADAGADVPAAGGDDADGDTAAVVGPKKSAVAAAGAGAGVVVAVGDAVHQLAYED